MRARLIVLMFLLAPATAGAQDAPPPADTARLTDVVVSATRLPMPRANLASSVTVLTGAALRAQGIQTVAEALRTVPGAALARNGSFGAVTSLFMRGGESDYVQVLVDGVPLNGPGGTFNYSALTTENVERIEIVAGPASVLYGSDAVTGVVQIFTRQGRGAETIEIGGRAGTFNTMAFDAGMQGGTERLDYSFTLSRFSTDGILPYNNEHRNLVASSRVHVRPDERSDVTFTLRYSDNTFHYPTDFTGALADRNQYTYGGGTALSLEAARRLSPRVEVRALFASHETDDGNDDQSDTSADTLGFFASTSLNHGRRRSADLRANLFLGKPGVLTVGAKLESQNYQGLSESRSQFGTFTLAARSGRMNRAAYVQAVLEPASRLSLVMGGRLDDNDKFGFHATYRAGVSVRPGSGTRLRGSVGTGFKEATSFESSTTPLSGGNPDLKPEESFSWEGGIEQDVLARLTLGVTYFSQRFRNMIQYNPGAPFGSPSYENVAEAAADGVEATARLALPRGLSLRAGYTWLKTWATDAGFDTGFDATFVRDSALLRRPANAVSATAMGAWSRGGASASVRHVGTRVDRNFSLFPSPRVELPAYTIVDFSGEVVLRVAPPRLTATARLENALDLDYAEIFNFPSPGRTLVVGGRVAF